MFKRCFAIAVLAALVLLPPASSSAESVPPPHWVGTWATASMLADVPGVESKDIDITAENGVLTIRGERRAEKKAHDKNGYERIERTSGSFLRRFTLPESANTETITAKQTNGVLEVSIPKHPQVQPRRISIEAA